MTRTTTKDLIARVITPRFLTEGDEAVVPLIVHNYLPSEKTVPVGMKAEGVTLRAGPGEPEATESRSIAIATNNEEKFAWRYAAERPGTAKFIGTATSDSDSDAVEISVPVLPFGLKRSAGSGGSIVGSGEIRAELTVPATANAAERWIRVSLAPSLAGAPSGRSRPGPRIRPRRGGRDLVVAAQRSGIERRDVGAVGRAPSRSGRADRVGGASRRSDVAPARKVRGESSECGWCSAVVRARDASVPRDLVDCRRAADIAAEARSRMDAAIMAGTGITRTAWLHTAIAWAVWFVRYGIGLSVAVTLMLAAATGGVRVVLGLGWPRRGLAPLQILAVALIVLLFMVLPWQAVYWRPASLPPNWLEPAFVTTKLLALYLVIHLGWALVLGTVARRSEA